MVFREGFIRAGCEDDAKRTEDLDESCHLTLFSNGVITICPERRNLVSQSDTPVKVFSMSSDSKCTSQIISKRFYFTIDNLAKCLPQKIPKNQHQIMEQNLNPILLGINEDRGGSLLEGCEWMKIFDNCASVLSKWNQFETAQKEFWLM